VRNDVRQRGRVPADLPIRLQVHGLAILLTYALFSPENLLWLAEPYVLGRAIDRLLKASYAGLWFFTYQQFVRFAVGVLRSADDTRMSSGIHANVLSPVVLEQWGRHFAVFSRAVLSEIACSRHYHGEGSRHGGPRPLARSGIAIGDVSDAAVKTGVGPLARSRRLISG